MKIVHISDLHFATLSVRTALREFKRGIDEQLARLVPEAALDIHTGDEDVLRSLRESLLTIDPDVVVVSGDITTFGDSDSFDAFGQWCQPLVRRAGKPDRKIVAVPGNHDALKIQFAQLRHNAENTWPFLRRVFWKLSLSSVLHPIDHLLSPRNIAGSETDPLKEFNAFLGRHDWISRDPFRLPLKTAGVRFVPFSTVSEDPVWMNLGQQRLRDWEKLQAQLREDSRGPTTVTIVIAHHNPISAPTTRDASITEIYNSMSGAGRFLKRVQELGVDLLLHGHHHENSLLKFDFDHRSAGHAFALGSESSSACRNGGFNELTIDDPNHVDLIHHQYNTEMGFTETDSQTLHLERNRPSGLGSRKTLAARYELKEYVYPSTDGADDVFASLQSGTGGLVYMSGRRFKTIREGKFKDLRAVLDGGGSVRVLLVDPDLIGRLSRTDSDLSKGQGDLWGADETLKAWAQEAATTLNAFEDLVASLGSAAKRIDVRLSHTLPPFGSYVRDPDKAWGKMSVKLLPIGGVGSLDSAVLRLNRRRDLALYDYYITHLKFLFLRAKPVLGAWRDDPDLRENMDIDLFSRSTEA